jgi:hypothetical protein
MPPTHLANPDFPNGEPEDPRLQKYYRSNKRVPPSLYEQMAVERYIKQQEAKAKA